MHRKKNKKKTLDLNRTVLLSQMKERVEAAFAAQDKSDVKMDISADTTPPNDQEQEVTSKSNPEVEEEEKSPKKSSPALSPKFVPSDESSNDTDDDTKTGNDAKLKNAILRNCFASLHRRQQIEKEKEYNSYLNGFD